jgi:hypothetical protein
MPSLICPTTRRTRPSDAARSAGELAEQTHANLAAREFAAYAPTGGRRRTGESLSERARRALWQS